MINTLNSYGQDELREALAGFGIVKGDTLLLHSGFSRFSGFSGAPEDVIAVMRSLIGDEGNLLMMSMPYGGFVPTLC